MIKETDWAKRVHSLNSSCTLGSECGISSVCLWTLLCNGCTRVILCVCRVQAKDGLMRTNRDPCRGQLLWAGTCQQYMAVYCLWIRWSLSWWSPKIAACLKPQEHTVYVGLTSSYQGWFQASYKFTNSHGW